MDLWKTIRLSDTNITQKMQKREPDNGRMQECDGFTVSIYADIEKKPLLEQIQIAVGYELMTGDEADIEQFLKDYIDCEIKESIEYTLCISGGLPIRFRAALFFFCFLAYFGFNCVPPFYRVHENPDVKRIQIFRGVNQ